MAPEAEIHPSDAVLRAFGQGRLSPHDAARLEEHFAQCLVCCEKLGQVGDDTFSELLRDRPGQVPDTPNLAQSPDDFPEIPVEVRRHGRYAILRRLGFGGMGVVYQALHRVMNRQVALKIIRPDLLATPLAVSRFRREVQSAARLTHANIVTAFDAEEIAGVHFLVMEYVNGRSLEQLVLQRGPLPVGYACDLARQIALGLAHAHGQGMIHRDIKPANVMISDEGQVKILDFGLACWSNPDATTPSLTQFGMQLGTPQFAAPEQLASTDRIDARADQYGLGATLYSLLTGKLPGKHESGEIFELPGHVPQEVRDIVKRLTAAAPENRFPSAEAAADALQPWCEGLSPATEILAAKPRRRNRRVFLAAGILAFVALLASLGYAWLKPAPGSATQPVLFLLPLQGLWYEDFQPAQAALEKAGLKTLIATSGGVPSRLHASSMLGKVNRLDAVPAGVDLMNVKPHHFAAVICVGYDHSEFTSEGTVTSEFTMNLLRLASRADKPTVGICAGQAVLGAAGLLQGKKVAQQSEHMSDLVAMGAAPQQGQSVFVDGNLITGSAPQDSAAAADALVHRLRQGK